MRMRFGGITESIGPMPSNTNLGPGTASRWSAPEPSQRTRREGPPRPGSSSTMSSGRLFLDRVARQQNPSPLHRQPQIKTLDTAHGRKYHQTVLRLFLRVSPKGCTPFICVYLRPIGFLSFSEK